MKKLLYLLALMTLLGQGWPYTSVLDRAEDDVANFGPASASIVTVARPPIVAEFRGTARGVRMWVDGQEVTAQARRLNESISFYPPRDLSLGVHEVRVTGRASDGSAINIYWTFRVQPEQ